MWNRDAEGTRFELVRIEIRADELPARVHVGLDTAGVDLGQLGHQGR